MDDFPKVFCGWSWEENKLFELALAVVDEQDPQRWEIVASMVGGKKSAEEVQKHYVILLEDLHFIESGKLDHKLGEVQPCVQVDRTHSVCWTDEDDKYHYHALYDRISRRLGPKSLNMQKLPKSVAPSIRHKLIFGLPGSMSKANGFG